MNFRSLRRGKCSLTLLLILLIASNSAKLNFNAVQVLFNIIFTCQNPNSWIKVSLFSNMSAFFFQINTATKGNDYGFILEKGSAKMAMSFPTKPALQRARTALQ